MNIEQEIESNEVKRIKGKSIKIRILKNFL